MTMVVQRLGKNVGRYCGETIDPKLCLQQIDQAIAGKNWVRDPDFLALRRPCSQPRVNIYISTGIHGDEPAGPLAVLKLLQDDVWPKDAAIWLLPMLNPAGLARNTRENEAGIDLNRDFRDPQSPEVRAHVDWLQKQPPFDLTLCLHEDWESSGFYVYEVNPENRRSLAPIILEAAARHCPIDMSAVIEDFPAENGVIRPQINPAERPRWPEALYLIMNKTRQSYTMEAPSDFPLAARVAALAAAVKAVVEAI